VRYFYRMGRKFISVLVRKCEKKRRHDTPLGLRISFFNKRGEVLSAGEEKDTVQFLGLGKGRKSAQGKGQIQTQVI